MEDGASGGSEMKMGKWETSREREWVEKLMGGLREE